MGKGNRKNKSITAPQEIVEARRKAIRYALYRIKAEKLEDVEPLETDLCDAVRKFFRKQPNFDGWVNFDETWDIGIDDLDTMVLRPAKWWLFGISKTTIVMRGEAVDSSNVGNSKFLKEGYAERNEQQPTRVDINYSKILTNCEERKSWL